MTVNAIGFAGLKASPRDTAHSALGDDGHPLAAAVVVDVCCARGCDRKMG